MPIKVRPKYEVVGPAGCVAVTRSSASVYLRKGYKFRTEKDRLAYEAEIAALSNEATESAPSVDSFQPILGTNEESEPVNILGSEE